MVVAGGFGFVVFDIEIGGRVGTHLGEANRLFFLGAMGVITCTRTDGLASVHAIHV